MRLVAVADTHGHELVIGRLAEADVFLHAGDLLRTGSVDELRMTAKWLRGLPCRAKVVIAGNSDWCFLEDPEGSRGILGDDVIYLQDQGTTVAGLHLWGSPWQPEYKQGAFNLPRGGALAEKWSLVPIETDILITHGPPLGYGDETPSGRIGCDDLLRRVRQVRPLLHLFGHAHDDGGVWHRDGLCFANVTTAAGRRGPTIFDIDPVTRTVTDISVPTAG